MAQVITKAMARFQPEALVMQMGADSVVGDLLGDFNLSNRGRPSPFLANRQATPTA